MSKECSNCGKFRTEAEAAHYGSRCEDCWLIPAIPSVFRGRYVGGHGLTASNKEDLADRSIRITISEQNNTD